MMSHAAPIRFAPAMEQIQDDEAATEASLDETMRGIQETTLENGGHPLRGVHAKSHGILSGTLTVADLPPILAQGLFARPGSYRTVMRFSTNPGDILPDDISVPRGLALKVIGVAGDRLPGSEGDTTQDFVLVNAPAFVAPTAEKFLGNLKMLAGTTDRFEGAKHVASSVARATEAALEAVGGESATLVTMGGHAPTHILGESFYSQTPFLFGPYICKFVLKPVSPNLVGLAGKALDVAQRPDALRDAVIAHFANEGGEWALQVQLNTDLATMPIEDVSVPWPEDQSPYVTVATLTAPPQNAWSDAARKDVDDGLSFGPWHGLAAHRPLGGVNRARRATYQHSAAFRGQRTGCPMHEPSGQ